MVNLQHENFDSYKAFVKAKEAYINYKETLNGQSDAVLEALENDYREKHLKFIHEQLNTFSKVTFNLTARHFHIF